MKSGKDGNARGRRRLFRFGGRDQVNTDIAEEMRHHLDSRVADLMRTGLSAEDARLRAQSEFGDVQASAAELFEIDRRIHVRRIRAEWLAGWRQDLNLAIRTLRRRPGFSATVVTTLALGIAATTSVFSLTNATLLKPLPYRNPDALVYIRETRIDDPSAESEASYPDLRDWRSNNRTFSSLDGFNQTNLTLSLDGNVSRIRGVRVTTGFLATLGVRPAQGRDFVASDEQQANNQVVVITDRFWRNQLGERGDVVGQKVLLDGSPHVVIGVLPREFQFAPTQEADIWMPLQPDARAFNARGFHWLNVVGRVRANVTNQEVRGDLSTLMRQLALQYPESNSGRTVIVRPLRDVVVGDVRSLMVLLLSATGFVLLIACVNVAGLLLARSTSRAQELAVRGALGASRTRMVRTLLTESLTLAAVGGFFGAIVSVFGVRLLVAAVPADLALSIPSLHDARVDGTALLVSAFIAVVCGVSAGLLPALNAGRQDISALMRQGGRTLAGRTSRSRATLIVAEIALTMILLIGTGLLGRSMLNLIHTNFGFDASQVLTARVALAGSEYQANERQQKYFEEFLNRVRQLSGVKLVGAVSNPPFNGGGSSQFRIEGEAEPTPESRPDALIRGVAGEYFETLRIPIQSGRAFVADDDSTRPGVIVVNATLTRRLFGNTSPIGRRLRFYSNDAKPWTIVGVVGDVRTGAIDQAAPATIYMSHLQAAENRMSIVVRCGGDLAELANRVRNEARAIDAKLPVYASETMTARIQRMPEVASRRFPLLLISAFSASALLLAAVGIYGLIAHLVSQRTREFGIRRALGAGKVGVISLVLRQGVTLALAGIVTGGVAAALLTHFMRTLLYGIPQFDAFTYAAVVALVMACALIASTLPATRAANIDPAAALRKDD